jgi:hypothetical protein
MRRIASPFRWSWDAILFSLLALGAALSLLPQGPWLIPLDLIAVVLLTAGAGRATSVFTRRKPT